MFQQIQQVGNLVATNVTPILRRDEGPDLAGHSPFHRRRSSPREALAKLPSGTDLLVSVNLTVPILGDCWGPLLVSANPPAVI